MPLPTVLGIFDSAADAQRVTDELIGAGVARHRIQVSRVPAEDALGADDPLVGRYPDPRSFEPLPSGACVVTVTARSHVDKQQIADLMRRLGARGTIEARA